MLTLVLVLSLVALAGCDSATDACDICTSSAIIWGSVTTSNGQPAPNVALEFSIAPAKFCVAEFPVRMGARGQADEMGTYRFDVVLGTSPGSHCVFGRAMGDSTTEQSGQVVFTSDWKRGELIHELRMDLVVGRENRKD